VTYLGNDIPAWEEGGWSPLAPLAGDTKTDVCVIGLGGSGLMAIEELAGTGTRVVGLDAGSLGGGAAGRNAGFLLAGLADFFHTMVSRFGAPLATALYRETMAEINRVRQRLPDHVNITGILRLAAGADEMRDCAGHLHALQRHGFPAETWSGPEGRGLLVPTDGIFQPLRFVRAQAADLLARGVRLFEGTRVLEISPGRVATATGTVSCHAIVVAVDGGLEHLLPGLRPRVRTARLQMLATAPAAEVSFSRPIYWRDGYEYWQQLPDRRVILGGFRDAGGPAEWTTEATPSAPVQERLEQFLRHRLKVTAPITSRWAASVSYTSERLPVLEEVRPGVFAAGAYSGTGNVVGRLCGRAAAQLATGAKSPWAELLQAARASAKERTLNF
jgi:glycine/D-amino acid oxidase-like deaminating enzyme